MIAIEGDEQQKSEWEREIDREKQRVRKRENYMKRDANAKIMDGKMSRNIQWWGKKRRIKDVTIV